MKLLEINEQEFEGIYDAMREAFPYEERRDRAAARALLATPNYRVFHTVEKDERVGFVALWELDGLTFVEHFVTYRPYRNQGLGRQALSVLQARYPALVLEAEHPETEMATRRLAFYARAGFVRNDYPYLQPSYHGSEGVPLILLSYPAALADPAAIAKLLKRAVYGQ